MNRTPSSTYRIQFSRNFTFRQAADLAPYLARLGITHVYSSPYLKARSGSTHGYDIVDHNEINPEIGTREDYQTFVEALRACGMGQILDIVPNHMGVGGNDNQWWLDVLESGQASPYADYFHIDWSPFKDELRQKVLLPVLGDRYGNVIERGELELHFEARHGSFHIQYYNHRFPVDPKTYPEILSWGPEGSSARENLPEPLQALIPELALLPGRAETDPKRLEERRIAKEKLKERLARHYEKNEAVRTHIDAAVLAINTSETGGLRGGLLHALLDKQAYRLAYWQVAADEINYRRFFDINELAGLRMEREEVFQTTHGLILDLIGEGVVQGLRIDHPDGLFDPAGYYRRLQQAIRERIVKSEGQGRDRGQESAFYVTVEKILASYERLPEDWPVAGTTGYDFANELGGFLVYAPALKEMERVYRWFSREFFDFDELLYQAKKLIMDVSLSSEMHVLANQLDRITEFDPHTRDFTLKALRDALTEIVAWFPVYRTYVTETGPSQDDRRYIDWAVGKARKTTTARDRTIFDFVQAILNMEIPEHQPPVYRRMAVEFVMRFQQYTAPVMAKGMEDTSFYIFNRLLSLNEVGGDPRRFGQSMAGFHWSNAERARRWPGSMLATSTHDTKRSEDVRSRLSVLSEMPGEWRKRLTLWGRANRRFKRKLADTWAPSRNDEYHLYQVIAGALPPGPVFDSALGEFRERVKAYMLKAVREAKVHSSWIIRNEEYEEGVTHFVDRLLSTPEANSFLNDLVPFVQSLSRHGLYNSLSQTLLKLTCPGVPDIYQGTEVWDFSLVDPDNRRPVDYEHRIQLIEEMDRAVESGNDRAAYSLSLLDSLEDGRAKLYLTATLLRLRRSLPALFESGDYVPVETSGENGDHLCVFSRSLETETLIVLAPRWFWRLTGGNRTPLGREVWGDTDIRFAESLSGSYINVLTEERIEVNPTDEPSPVAAGDLLLHFPVALLRKVD